jgi:hypothetical protein
MLSRSPTLEGFRTILRRPSFGFAEIAWRWAFGVAALVLITFSLREYLATLPVSRDDLFLLNTHQPALVSRAIADIFHGSGFRFIRSSLVLAVGLGMGWIIIAALSRAATARSLLDYFSSNLDIVPESRNRNLSPLLALSLFRIAAILAATVGGVAAFVFSSRASESAPEVAAFVFLTILLLVWLTWSMLNWVLSLAAVCSAVDGTDTFSSIGLAIDLCRTQTGRVLAAGTWFGLAHVIALLVFSSITAFPLAFARLLPPAVVLGGVLTSILLYLAVVDFLYAGRVAAYVVMIEFPPSPVSNETEPTPLGPDAPIVLEEKKNNAIDRGELILSDVPQPG